MRTVLISRSLLVLALLAAGLRAERLWAGEPAVTWTASWVTCDGAEEPNAWLAFRKRVVVSDADADAIAEARIACDSKYWLWINGELAIFEGQLKRGPRRGATYFDRIDLTGKLRPGENTFAVLVWHFGREGMSHKDSGLGGLLFDATIGEQVVRSDASWKAQKAPGYYATGDPKPNWRLPESNVGFDARNDLAGWTGHDFDDSRWPAAWVAGPASGEPWGDLVQRPIPLWRDLGLKPYPEAPATPFVATGEPIRCQLPYNAQVTPVLRVEAEAGRLIGIRTDNFRGGSEPNVRAEYRTRAGEQEYESLGWMNGHEVIYQIPAGVKVLDLAYRETGYDTDLAGSFACDDERLNSLWRKAQRTLYVNMRDAYFDCPGRERAQWWGDVTLEFQQAFYALDRRSDRLARKAIRELAAWQKPDQALFSPIPAGNWDKELPMQMLASVGRQGFWEYYRHTGDEGTIRTVYPAVTRYLALWDQEPSGIVTPRKGGWTWGDWGTNKDMPLLFNGWYALALDGHERMAELVGDARTAADRRERRARLRKAFDKAFWTGTAYRSPGHRGPIDDRGTALAIVSGLADERLANAEDRAAIVQMLTEARHASPYMEKYVLESLLLLGEEEAAKTRMLDRYAAMIDSPITTLWEGWGIGSEGYGGGSYNHAWSGGVLTLLSQYVAGVDPLEPGYARVAVRPQLGTLRFAEAKVPTPLGELTVRTDRITTGHAVRIEAPEGMTCVVTPPGGGDSVTVEAGTHRLVFDD